MPIPSFPGCTGERSQVLVQKIMYKSFGNWQVQVHSWSSPEKVNWRRGTDRIPLQGDEGHWVYFTLPRLFHMEWVWNGWNPWNRVWIPPSWAPIPWNVWWIPPSFHPHSMVIPPPFHPHSTIIPPPFHTHSMGIPPPFHPHSIIIPHTIFHGMRDLELKKKNYINFSSTIT